MKHLWLGLGLIAATSGVLLLSDLGQRSGDGDLPRVALIQHASQGALDDGVRGMLAGLAEGGYVDGRTVAIQRFNAENDIATANSIASQVVDGGFDLLLTASTLSLQTVANANRDGRTNHVFGIVADPFSAGVGINREDPLDHPEHLTGIGSLIPVDRAFNLARRLYPGLERVGLVWNSAEANSLAFTVASRAVSEELGIELLEANAENSSAVLESASSLTSRGAEALFISGDVMVLVAAESVVTAANRARIPVFTIIPPTVESGALFDLGADFEAVGRDIGLLAARVLDGAAPAEIPVVNSVPERLTVNTTALADLRDPWVLPDDVISRAQLLIDEDGPHERAVSQTATAEEFEIGIVYFAPEEGADLVFEGLFDGLEEEGIEEGRNLQVSRAHAQGEIANIPALLQNYDGQGLDLIVTLTTPCLTAACTVVRNTPVVFTYVFDPVAAGAGTSFTDHLPNVTGIGSFPPVEDTVDVIQTLVPGVSSVGTLYTSSEANSRAVVGVAREIFSRRNIDLQEVTITGTGEIFQAAQVLAQRNIEAMWVTGDNTALQGFDAIVRAASDAGLPLIINDPEFVERGALAAVGVGWYEAGHRAAGIASRVLRGTRAADIPIENVAVKKVVLNHEVAERLGISFPPDLLAEESR